MKVTDEIHFTPKVLNIWDLGLQSLKSLAKLRLTGEGSGCISQILKLAFLKTKQLLHWLSLHLQQIRKG